MKTAKDISKMSDVISHNDQFKILEHKVDNYRYEIYLVNPGQFFEGFGGSRHGLQVKKTASLIIRQRGPHGLRDTEYDIADKDAWESIERIKAGYTPFDPI